MLTPGIMPRAVPRNVRMLRSALLAYPGIIGNLQAVPPRGKSYPNLPLQNSLILRR